MTPGTPWLSDGEQRTWRGFLAATKGLDAALGAQLQAASGLSTPDYEVLVVLSEAPDQALRVMALAETLGWERSRLSHHLTRMEKRDLVRRMACPEDARGQRIELTDAGRAKITSAAPGHVAAVRRHLFEPLDADDLAALDRISARITAALPPTGPA